MIVPGSSGANGGRAIAVGDTVHIVSDWGELFYYTRSFDNGLFWSQPVIIPDSSYAFYNPDIIYSKGRIHIACIDYSADRQQVYHISSSDGGRSWGSPHQVFNNRDPMVRPPRIAANGDTLFICYRTSSEFLSFYSRDAGLTWHRGANIEGGPIVIDQDPAVLFTNGRIHVIFSLAVVGDSFTFEIYDRYSDNMGIRWHPRIPLSTLEPLPNCRASQIPSAYADSAGNIIALWMDYKYGGMCAVSGEILGRFSSDNGYSWSEELRLTDTQSGCGSSCVIKDGIIYAIWEDFWPLGCEYPKILFSSSQDWGQTWSEYEAITDFSDAMEEGPNIFFGSAESNSLLHCLFRVTSPNGGLLLYHAVKDISTSIGDEANQSQIKEISISAYPNPFNSNTMITFNNPEGGDLEIGIYDLMGRQVRTFNLIRAKEGEIKWDARDAMGNRVSTGIYFARAREKSSQITTKLIYLK